MWSRAKAFLIWVTLAIIAILSAGSAVWMIREADRAETSYKQHSKDAAEADANRAQINMKRSCAPLALPQRAKCEAEIEYAAHQAGHDDRDLEAQRTTAVWTRYLGIAGIAGTAFGLLGVALVLFTFREQRKTTRAELRAYVSVEFLGLEAGPDRKIIGLINMKNGGQTPAYRLYHGGDVLATTPDEAKAAFAQLKGIPPEIGKAEMKLTLHAGTGKGAKAVPFDFREFDLETMMKVVQKQLNLYVYGCVTYHDTFGEKHTTTYAFVPEVETIHNPPGNLVVDGFRYKGAYMLAPFLNTST